MSRIKDHLEDRIAIRVANPTPATTALSSVQQPRDYYRDLVADQVFEVTDNHGTIVSEGERFRITVCSPMTMAAALRHARDKYPYPTFLVWSRPEDREADAAVQAGYERRTALLDAQCEAVAA